MVELQGSVDFDLEEFRPLTSLTLSIEGPQPLEGNIPLEEGTHLVTGPTVPGSLECTVDFDNVAEVSGADYGYPAYAYGFKGFGPSASINVLCYWDAPVFLDPGPVFSMVPNTELIFALPEIPPTPEPTPGGPDALPNVTELFPIPLAPTPEPDANAPTELPGTDLAFAIPAIPTPTPDPDANSALPTLDVLFTLSPIPTPTPIVGVPVLPATEKVFDIPGAKIPTGITTDGTDFYVLVNGSDADEIIKVAADGTYIATFDLGAQCYTWDLACDPGMSGSWFHRDQADAIAYLNGLLWIALNNHDGENYRVLAFDPATGLESESDSFVIQDFAQYGGLHADGTRLWAVDKNGDRLVKLHVSGTVLSTFFIGFDSRAGLAVNGDVIVTASGDKIQLFTKDGGEPIGAASTLTGFIIRGTTFSDSVLYVADLETSAIYKTQLPSTIQATTDPRALTTDGTNIYVLVDGQPVDVIQVLDAAGTLLNYYDAPDNSGEGLTYMGGSLYYAGKDPGGRVVIYELNPTDGSVLNGAGVFPRWNWGGDIWEQPHGLGNDGTDLLLTVGSHQAIIVIDANTGDFEDEYYLEWPDADSQFSGARGVAMNGDYSNIYLGDDDDLQRLSSDGQAIVDSWSALASSDIQGLTFLGSNLLIADDDTDTIYGTSIPSGTNFTTNPLAMAHGNPLYILVGGDPVNQIEIVNADTGALIDYFAAPDDEGQGLTYLDGVLYYSTRQEFGAAMIYRLDPDTGEEVADPIIPQYQWGGDVFDVIRALGNDGTNLIFSVGSDQCMSYIDPNSGESEGQFCPPPTKAVSGPRGIDIGDSGQIIGSKDNKVVVATSESSATKYTTTLSDIEGQAFDSGILYLANNGDNSIYKASLPSNIASSAVPKGLTTDGTYLYTLVEASPADKIVKTTLDGTYVDSFDVNDGFEDFDDTGAIVYLDGMLWVAVVIEPPFCCGGITQRLLPLDPTDGTAGTPIEFPEFDGPYGHAEIRGLGTDGTDFYIGFDNSEEVHRVSTSGNIEEQRWFSTGHSGVDSVTVRTDSGSVEYFNANGGTITRVGWDSDMILDDWDVPISKIQGMTFVGDFLYLAEDGENKIWAAAIPQAPVTFTTNPNGFATDGTNFWVAYQGSPFDKIVKMVGSDGTYIESFTAPLNNIGGLTYMGDSLYAVGSEPNNDPFCFGCTGPLTVYQFNPDTGALIDDWKLNSAWGPGDFFGNATGLTTDGSQLILVVEDHGGWFLIEAGSTTKVDANTGPPCFYGPCGWSSAEVVLGNLITIQGNFMVKHDLETGETVGSPAELNDVTNVTGIAYIGSTLHLATDYDDSVYGTVLPENQPERTITGSYDSSLSVTHNLTITSPIAQFDIVKIDEVVVTLDTPEDGSTVSNELQTVTGSVNDLSVDEIQLGLQLAFTTLFSDGAEDGSASASKWIAQSSNVDVGWNIYCDDTNLVPPGSPVNYASEGECSWRYSQPFQGMGQPPGHYDTFGTPNFGTLTTANPILVGPDTELFFTSWYDTEGSSSYDQKLVEVSTDGGSSWTAIAQIADFQMGEGPANAHASFQWIFQPVSPFDFGGGFGGGGAAQPIFMGAGVYLGDFSGEEILLRFKFDTIDAAINDLRGWFIDDVTLNGSGGKIETAAIPSCLNGSGDVVDTGCDAGEFATYITFAEGQNTVGASATSLYATNEFGFPLSDLVTVQVFLDTTFPMVSIFDPQSPTNAPVGTIAGEYQERTFDFLQMTVSNSLGEKVIFSQKPGDPGTPAEGDEHGTFSASVPYVEGLNVITVSIKDNAERTAEVSVTVLVDQTAPSVNVLDTVYPIGVVAARANDPFIFQVNVSDAIGVTGIAAAGIACVEFLPPGAEGIGLCEGELFLRPHEVLEAIRVIWGTEGEWLLPALVPADLPPGSFDLTARVVDRAGNYALQTLTADIVASLSAINVGLMPGFNLKALPLIPNNTDLTDMLGHPRQITDGASNTVVDTQPAFSPDGTRVAFVRPGSVSNPGFDNEIWVADYDGQTLSNEMQLTNNSANDGDPAWTAGGGALVFTRDNVVDGAVVSRDLRVMKADGSLESPLTNALTGEFYHQPAVAPDGGSVAYAFTVDSFFDVFVANWNAEGAVPFDLSGGVNLTNDATADDISPAWAPDGMHIAYISDPAADDAEIWVMANDGSSKMALTDNASHESEPTYAPDGEWIAFSSDSEGALHIHALEVTNPSYVVQITYDSGDGYPTWSPGDSRIIHDTGPNGDGELMSVQPQLFQAIESISYYDAPGADCPTLGEACWSSFRPDEAPDNLTELTTGRGYWFKTRNSEFAYSAPLPGLTVQTPAVINLSYEGRFLEPGVVPPAYPAVAGWNLLGMHAEVDRPVRDVLSGLQVPQRVWTSTLVYKNFIDFPIVEIGSKFGDGTIEIVLGSFGSLNEDDLILVTEGMWVRVREGEAGTIVP